MQIKRSGARPTRAAPEAYFTGAVTQEPLVEAPAPGRLRGLLVSFPAGARTAWHTHPFGQMLLIVSGRCWAQRWGGPREELGVGDAVWFEAGEKHWHGAAADAAMTHLACQEALDGETADWMEKVSDAQYLGRE